MPFIAIFAVIWLWAYQLIKTWEVSSEVFLILWWIILRGSIKKLTDNIDKGQ